MAKTPILQIDQVAPGQADKETTINTALAILEAAGNDSKTHSAASADVVINIDLFTRYVFHRVSGHTVDRTVWIPDSKRLFIVANEGSGALYVRPNGSAAGQVTVPAGKIMIMATDGNTIRALSSGASQLQDLSDVEVINAVPGDGDVLKWDDALQRWTPGAFAATNFLGLADTPSSYTGAAGKLVTVKPGANGVEFTTPTTGLLTDFPTYDLSVLGRVLAVNEAGDGLEFIPAAAAGVVTLGSIQGVEIPSSVGDGFVLTYDADAGVFTPLAAQGGAVSFLDLTDSPDSYAGQIGKSLRVNAAGDALEFFTPSSGGDEPTVQAYRYWRVRARATNGGTYWSVSDVEFRTEAGTPELPSGGAAISGGDYFSPTTKDFAFDGLFSTRWASAGDFGSNTRYIGYQYASPVAVTEVAIRPADGYASAESATIFDIDASEDGIEWITMKSVVGYTLWSENVYSLFAVEPRGVMFTDLGDTPDSYAGEGGKFLRVKADETGLEYKTVFIPSQLNQLADVEEGTSVLEGDVLRRRDGVWQAEPWEVRESIIVALGDETTAITAGNAKVTIRMPYRFKLYSVKASLTSAGASQTTVDINKGGATLLTTKLTLDAGEKTSATAATPAVISDTQLEEDDEVTFDIDAAGASAAGLKVYLVGRQN